jgi:hypothetical protein
MGFAHLFAVAGAALVAGVWEGCVLVAAVALMLRLMPRVSARARSVIWLAVLVLVVLLPFLHGVRGGGAVAANEVQAGFGWTLGLAAVWIFGSLVRAGRLIWSGILLRGIAGRARPLEVSAEIGELLAGRAVVCVSDEVTVPSVAGFFSPRILLPSEVAGLIPEADLRQIVVHEMEHLRRGDDWVNLLQKMSLVVFPLNPALLWVEKRLCAERELACDDAVLRAGGSAKAYASCLAHLAEHTLVRRGVTLALGAWERRPELARRVARILARPQGEMRHSRVVVAMMLVGVVGGAAELSRAPRMVRFAAGREVAVAQVEVPVAAASPSVSGRMVLTSAKMPASVRRDGLVGDGVVADVKPTSRKRNSSTGSGQVVGHAVLVGYPVHARRPAHPSNDKDVAKVGQSVSPEYQPISGEYRSVSAAYVAVRVEDGLVGRRVLLSFDEDSQVSYAAVPIRNGWLIFQL